MLTLYDYFRSTASYRVRIALNLKNLAFDKVAIHLVKDGGQQHSAEYLQHNPQGLVPTLVDDKFSLTQSIAIMEYLEEKYPAPALLPKDLQARAQVRAIAQLIACDIHPLNNLRVLQYLTGPGSFSEDEKLTWYKHWLAQGFSALEQMLTLPIALQAEQSNHRKFCVGDEPTMADICLVAQVYNAERFACPMIDYPTISAINAHCSKLPAFANANPDLTTL